MSELPLFRKIIRHDLLASIVVFLVALPLCMGIAIASGAPPALGLISGIIGGIVVGSLSGAPLLVSGPAAGLAVIVADLIHKFGLPKLGLIVLLAGALQITASLLGLGQWFRAVSPAVVHGMLAGIGVLIFSSQFHVMVDDLPRATGLENILSLPEAIWKGLIPQDDPSLPSTNYVAARIGMLTILVIVLWNTVIPKKFRIVPAPLVGVTVATVEAALQNLNIRYVSLPENLFSELNIVSLERFSGLLDPELLGAAVALAFVASIETLLSATAIDQLHTGPRTDYDRELLAQGTGNVFAGFLGVLPITGVIVRGTANVMAGAQTRASSILHGIWLLLFVALLPFVLELIPTAALAAVLVYTGYKLVNVAAVRDLRQYGWGEIIIYAATLITIVVKDLLTGVILGIVLATGKLVYTLTHLEIQQSYSSDGKRLDIDLLGSATFVCLPKLASTLEAVPPHLDVHIHFEHLQYIDHASLDLVNNWEKQHVANGGSASLDWEAIQNRYSEPRTGTPLSPE